MTDGIVALFLVAPLVVVPLGLRSIERANDRRSDLLMRFAILSSVPSAITLADWRSVTLRTVSSRPRGTMRRVSLRVPA